jgi:hypothetical protein
VHWRNVDPNHAESECKRYRVSRARMFDRVPEGEWRYTAWRCGEPAVQLGDCCDEFKSAEKACVDDAAARSQEAA